jgi:hypothetical protein
LIAPADLDRGNDPANALFQCLLLDRDSGCVSRLGKARLAELDDDLDESFGGRCVSPLRGERRQRDNKTDPEDEQPLQGLNGTRAMREVARCPGYNARPRGCGGIGRRARFRSVWGKPRGGSSPLIRIAISGGFVAYSWPRPPGDSPRARDLILLSALEAFGQAGELWKTLGHVPAPATADAEPVDGRNERSKSVPFHLERVAGPKGEVGRTSQHRIGQPQVHPLPRLLRRSRLAAVGRG